MTKGTKAVKTCNILETGTVIHNNEIIRVIS